MSFLGCGLILTMAGKATGEIKTERLEEWRKLKVDWRAALVAQEPRRLETAAMACREWRKQQGPDYIPSSEQERESFELLDFAIAGAWARAGNGAKALFFLRKEAAPYRQSNGRFLEQTRNPDGFAVDVFELHAAINAQMGDLAKVPGVDYQVMSVGQLKDKPNYAFVYEPIDDCEGGVLVQGLAEDEQRRMIVLIVPDAGKFYRFSDRAEVIGRRGKVVIRSGKSTEGRGLRVSGVTKFIHYIGEGGVPDVHISPLAGFDLRISNGKLEQPHDAIQRLQAATSINTDMNHPGSGGKN